MKYKILILLSFALCATLSIFAHDIHNKRSDNSSVDLATPMTFDDMRYRKAMFSSYTYEPEDSGHHGEHTHESVQCSVGICDNHLAYYDNNRNRLFYPRKKYSRTNHDYSHPKIRDVYGDDFIVEKNLLFLLESGEYKLQNYDRYLEHFDFEFLVSDQYVNFSFSRKGIQMVHFILYATNYNSDGTRVALFFDKYSKNLLAICCDKKAVQRWDRSFKYIYECQQTSSTIDFYYPRYNQWATQPEANVEAFKKMVNQYF